MVPAVPVVPKVIGTVVDAPPASEALLEYALQVTLPAQLPVSAKLVAAVLVLVFATVKVKLWPVVFTAIDAVLPFGVTATAGGVGVTVTV